MSKYKSLFFRYFLLLFIIANAFYWQGAVSAQSPIAFHEHSHENNFPGELIFRTTAAASGGEITSARLIYTTDNRYSSDSFTKVNLEISPAAEIDLEYAWDTEEITIPPSAPIMYYWEVADSNGNTARSEEITIRYDDTRYDWQILENENVGVWWHGKPEAFGKSVFEIANRALAAQYPLFQTDLDFQIRIIIYNNFDEFAAWHGVAHEWVGGEAFTNYGITTQIVQGSAFQESWLNGVIPHEISHLYFAQVTYNPTTSIPVWLNEGLAQYNEFISHQWELNQVYKAVEDGSLIHLSALNNGFGAYNEERVYLAYNESLSAVTFFVEAYGEDELAALLASYKQGLSTDDALQAVIGMDMEGFERAWAAWLGVPEGKYIIPTSIPSPTFYPSPTMMTFGTADPNKPTSTPRPTSTTVPSSTPAPPESVEEEPLAPERGPCLAAFPVLLIGLGSVFHLSNAKKKVR
ncbi:MAG: peptidase MA family metallohydrolase [Chloroflexota bacterium]